ALACPEQTIRDIIVADLNQLYADRARTIWAGPRLRDFWQKPSPRISPNHEQTERLRALEQEKQSVMQQLLGVRVQEQELINLLMMQPDGTRIDLAFLPNEKREAAYRALSDANLAGLSRTTRLHNEWQQ